MITDLIWGSIMPREGVRYPTTSVLKYDYHMKKSSSLELLNSLVMPHILTERKDF